MNKYPIYRIRSINMKLIAGSVVFIILGYILMHYGSKHNMDFLSMTVSPIMQLIGYVTIIIAIIKN